MKFNTNQVVKIVQHYYNMDCDAKVLDGYVDHNYRIEEKDGSIYLLKVCIPETDKQVVDFQVSLLDHLQSKDLDFSVPSVIKNKDGESYFEYEYEGKVYFIRMHSWVQGRMLAEVNPRTEELYYSWGETCGKLSKAFEGFDHEGAHRFDEWNPVESLYSKRYLQYFDDETKVQLAEYFWNLFETDVLPRKDDLRFGINHSDAHENNLLVEGFKIHEGVAGVIDFGDAIYAPRISELAIACAYAGMYCEDPIQTMKDVVRGFHDQVPIEEEELSILFPMICGRLMISVSNAAYQNHINPHSAYHQTSANPAWKLLNQLKGVSAQLAHYSFRSVCGLEPHPKGKEMRHWLRVSENEVNPPIALTNRKIVQLDLGVGSTDLGGNQNFATVPAFCKKVDQLIAEKEGDYGIGGYGEIRPFYTTDAYKVEGNNGPKWRTMHLGTDFWTPKRTPVYAFCDGTVYSVYNNDNPCDYGPTIILEHSQPNGLKFYTLYGHLSVDSLSHVVKGQRVKKGEEIAWVGADDENGEWPPHLHFQLILDLLGNTVDFPGVCFVEDADIWLSICPNHPDFPTHFTERLEDRNQQIVEGRQQRLGRNLSTSYRKHLHMVRGAGVYLYDSSGRRYIDTVNNVAHVGHEHPKVVKAAQRQIELLNTNTRYLHKNIVEYANRLLAKCPSPLEVVYFVNSGSEANELALRMAKIYTGQIDIIALESGYHGNTGACIEVSSYKFDGKGGQGAPEYTTKVIMPDVYRGIYRERETSGEKYAMEVQRAIMDLHSKNRNVAAFLAESILSCGGQIVLPEGYLNRCYELVRAQGGLCIADEVQVGFGRVGSHFWGFELQDVVPDIVTCGKPIGNGHPLAALITTRAVADAFENGMEFFNTFGGNPVSCAIGNEVLSVINDEKLQENAQTIGAIFLDGLQSLSTKYDIIGDVRGEGLFLGIELVKDRNTLQPAAEEAEYLVNRMREMGVLMSTDGPLHNVIKMKPPMCISRENVEEILGRLDKVFQEDFMKF